MTKFVALAAGLVLFLTWERLRPFLVFPPGHRRVHWVGNGLVSAFDAVFSRVAFSGLTAWALGWVSEGSFGLLGWLPLPGPVRFLAGFFLLDGWTYFWHRANHRWPLLWRFHRAHHADTEMDATTALRFHPVELGLSTLLRVPLYLGLGIGPETLVWYEAVLVVSTLFHHANIVLPGRWDEVLRWVVVTPVMHKLHHSVLRHESDSNYSSLFSWWDRWFGTWTTTSDPRTIVLGLGDHRGRRWQTLRGILETPFRDEEPPKDP